MYSVVAYIRVRYHCRRLAISPLTVPTYFESGYVGRTEAKSDLDSTVMYRVVLLITVRYQCRRLIADYIYHAVLVVTV
jgi:hypothetical protein